MAREGGDIHRHDCVKISFARDDVSVFLIFVTESLPFFFFAAASWVGVPLCFLWAIDWGNIYVVFGCLLGGYLFGREARDGERGFFLWVLIRDR